MGQWPCYDKVGRMPLATDLLPASHSVVAMYKGQSRAGSVAMVEFQREYVLQALDIDVAFVLDIDECLTSANTCPHACKNLIGSFVCTCPTGYRQIPGSDECRGKDC